MSVSLIDGHIDGVKELSRECEDCKYFEKGNCTHPYKNECENCSLWWSKGGAENA